jgi:hypothetical protein
VNDLNAVVVAMLFFQLGFDLRRVANEKKLSDVTVFAQGKNRSPNQVRRTKVAPHRIERDFHASQKFAFIAALMQNEKTSSRAKSRDPVAQAFR